jgi:hypothetical protein
MRMASHIHVRTDVAMGCSNPRERKYADTKRSGKARMRDRLTSLVIVPIAALALTSLAVAQTAPQYGTQPGTDKSVALTLAPGTPDLSGVWNMLKGDGGFWASYAPDDKFGQKGLHPPMTDWGWAHFKTAVPGEGIDQHEFGVNDPATFQCLPPSVPRVYMEPNPIEFIQLPGRVFEVFEIGNAWRIIFTDGRPHPADTYSKWWGNAIGHYEGDTLVVDTVGFVDGRIWLDRVGHPVSDQMHLIERIRRVDKNTMTDDFTIDDPKAYKTSWTIHKTFALEPTWELNEDICTDMGDWANYLNSLTKGRPNKGTGGGPAIEARPKNGTSKASKKQG